MTLHEALNKYIVVKNKGEGLASCYGCEQSKGWNRIWYSMTFTYDGKVYCSTCITKIIRGIL